MMYSVTEIQKYITSSENFIARLKMVTEFLKSQGSGALPLCDTFSFHIFKNYFQFFSLQRKTHKHDLHVVCEFKSLENNGM